MSIHRIPEYCENLVLRTWRKKYLSGKSGGERKKYPSANPAMMVSFYAVLFPMRCLG